MIGRSKVDQVIYKSVLICHHWIVDLGLGFERKKRRGYVSIVWAKPFNNDLKHVCTALRGAAGRPREYWNGENSFGWRLAFTRRSQKYRRIDGDDGHTRSRERKLTRVFFFTLFSISEA